MIVILADDLDWADVSTYGRADAPTPNIDRIARSGVAFSSGYVVASVCAVSRAGLLTARMPQRFGFTYNISDESDVGAGLPVDQKTLAERLRPLGYRSAANGKWHQGAERQFYPTNRGFDEFFGFVAGETSYVDPATPGMVTTPTRADKYPIAPRTGDHAMVEGPDPLTHTPTIDGLARKGLLFRNVYSNAPVCAPSRFGILTGVNPESCAPANQMRAVGHLPSSFPTYPELMRAAGYYCTNNAKTDYNCDVDPNAIWDGQGKAAHWRSREDKSQPFMAVFNYETTHESRLFQVTPGRVTPTMVKLPAFLPDTPGIRQDFASYYNLMEKMDGELGARLAELEADGLSEDTIVFYYSDNRGVLPRSKRYCFDEDLRCAMVVHAPPRWQHLLPGVPAAGSIPRSASSTLPRPCWRSRARGNPGRWPASRFLAGGPRRIATPSACAIAWTSGSTSSGQSRTGAGGTRATTCRIAPGASIRPSSGWRRATRSGSKPCSTAG